ncbi:sulfatase [Carboxylicivirga sp. M1479]|uniref:sulfatase family protein n=1 Tax=Carboxylicivirga sp. M1479 TaxID=2594476 RepID=UPI0011777808|nr:sulfatase [Carboxylicivirga sp. M1479]TRX66422.1 sulfatase [Carboxylicivirga sp. M1479]
MIQGNRNRIAAFCLGFVMWIGIQTIDGKEIQENRKPNIIILFADDLGYGDLGCYGSNLIETPHIDQMAMAGMQFTDFYVSAASCTPSRASLMTGVYAARIGLEKVVDDLSTKGLSSEVLTIANYLKQDGYKTALFGKWHLGHHPEFMPRQHGFDEFFGIPYSMDMWPFHPKPSHNYPAIPLYHNDEVIEYNPDVNTLTQRLTAKTLDYIKANKDEAFFVYLPYPLPHVPLGASKQFKGKSKAGLYGDAVMEIDWSVGQIVQALKKLKIEENTLILFSSDNGPWLSYGDHAGSAGELREGKGTTFEGGQRVPFIVSMPGTIPPGSTCTKLVSSLDVLPTILDITNQSLLKTIDGKSIYPLFLNPQAETVNQAFYFMNGRRVEAVRLGQWKLHVPHRYRVVNKVGGNGQPGNQDNFGGSIGLTLYNLEIDAAESKNVAHQHPKVVEELTQLILDFEYDIIKNSRPAGIIKIERW